MGIADKILKVIMRPAVKSAFESMNKDGEIDELVKSMQHHQFPAVFVQTCLLYQTS